MNRLRVIVLLRRLARRLVKSRSFGINSAWMAAATSLPQARRGYVFWGTTFLVVNLSATLLTISRVRDDLQYGHAVPWQHRAAEELIGAYSALALLPALAWLVWRFPPSFRSLLHTLARYAAALVVYWIVHTGLISLLRLVFFGRSDINPVAEIPHDVIAFGSFLACAAAWGAIQRVRRHELEAEQLRRSASEAQLEALRARLHPHFLFNTLNTISSVMYDDPERAEVMIAQLGDMLRTLLKGAPTHEIPLAEERDLLAKYAALVHARFGDGVRIDIDMAQDVLDTRVPALLLQPLVENAVRHGRGPGIDHLGVQVKARKTGDCLDVEVVDNGRGKGPAQLGQGTGVGLTATAERLRLMYGDAARFQAGYAEGDRGFRVHLSIPIRVEAST